MADIVAPDVRSRNMAAIRNMDTAPEVYLRKKLYSLGIRYRKNYAAIEGHPDIWLGKYNVAVFVNGCFWHRHENCKYSYTPKTRVDYWNEKFEKNMARDRLVRKKLCEQGIRVLVVWECTLKEMQKNNSYESFVLDSIVSFLHSEELYLDL